MGIILMVKKLILLKKVEKVVNSLRSVKNVVLVPLLNSTEVFFQIKLYFMKIY